MINKLESLLGIQEIDDSSGKRFSFKYDSSLFRRILIPVLYLIIVLLRYYKSIFKSVNINEILPSSFNEFLKVIFNIIYIIGELIYSNYLYLFILLSLLIVIIMTVGYRGLLHKVDIFNDKIVQRNGLIKSRNFISAWKRLLYFLWFTMTDLWILFYFSSCVINHKINIPYFEVLDIVFLVTSTLSVLVLFFNNIFFINYPERYTELKADDIINDEKFSAYSRYYVINKKTSDKETVNEVNYNDYNYIHYFMKDKYITKPMFLYVKIIRKSIKLQDNMRFKDSYSIKRIYNSDDFNEVKYVFDEETHLL